MRTVSGAIMGFVIGIMLGLLIGLIEMRLFKNLKEAQLLPFVIGITVIVCAITGVITGIRRAKRINNS